MYTNPPSRDDSEVAIYIYGGFDLDDLFEGVGVRQNSVWGGCFVIFGRSPKEGNMWNQSMSEIKMEVEVVLVLSSFLDFLS